MTTIRSTKCMNVENILLSSRSQAQKTTYCRIRLSEISRLGKSRDTRQISRCLGLEAGYYRGNEERQPMGKGFLSGDRLWRWLHSSVSILKTTVLYTFNSRKLYQEKKIQLRWIEPQMCSNLCVCIKINLYWSFWRMLGIELITRNLESTSIYPVSYIYKVSLW